MEICSYIICYKELTLCEKYKCDKCKKTFCYNHLTFINHECEVWKKEEQERLLNIEKSTKINENCCKEGCTEKINLTNKFICHQCKNIFCIEHRHDFNHSCSK